VLVLASGASADALAGPGVVAAATMHAAVPAATLKYRLGVTLERTGPCALVICLPSKFDRPFDGPPMGVLVTVWPQGSRCCPGSGEHRRSRLLTVGARLCRVVTPESQLRPSTPV